MIGCNHNDFSIVGDITVINKNIKLGHNVTIYPDVMLFGDGEIVIGDNVDILETERLFILRKTVV